MSSRSRAGVARTCHAADLGVAPWSNIPSLGAGNLPRARPARAPQLPGEVTARPRASPLGHLVLSERVGPAHPCHSANLGAAPDHLFRRSALATSRAAGRCRRPQSAVRSPLNHAQPLSGALASLSLRAPQGVLRVSGDLASAVRSRSRFAPAPARPVRRPRSAGGTARDSPLRGRVPAPAGHLVR